MKLIALNLWAGREYDALTEFLERMSKDIDIFCFQEALDSATAVSPDIIEFKREYAGGRDGVPDLYHRLKLLLDGFGSFLGRPNGGTGELRAGEQQAIFFRQGLSVVEHGEHVLNEPVTITRNGKKIACSSTLQYIKVKEGDDAYLIGNLHGLWQGGGKQDTPDRLVQSERIAEFLSKSHEKKILVGDFNLEPETESVKRIEQSGMTNLIKLRGVKTTRSRLAPSAKGAVADYAFVSDNVKVRRFEVLQDVVSDHLPLYIDFY